MLKGESLTEKVYMDLKEGILSGRLKKNEKINIDYLVKQLGVSKIPIREAVFRLNQEGLLFYKTNVGTRVVEINFKDVLELVGILNKLTDQDTVIDATSSRVIVAAAIESYRKSALRTKNKRLISIVENLCAQLKIWK